MEILSASLRNFKSHRDRHFTFQPGTNAICGENGAGKTSILEAIAWVLFNYRGAYRTEDLIRDGAATTQVRVQFVSSRDSRTYEVCRCSRVGYTLYDPQLGAKLEYSRIEDEVQPWLRQHLGVAAGTDLARLFATTIGIPQGTFTADFLLSAEKRKPIFDTILKVEEYRETTQQMLSLEKYAKAEVEKLDLAIAQYDETLQNWDSLTTKHQELEADIQSSQIVLQQHEQQLQVLKAELDQLSATVAQIQTIEAQLETFKTQIQTQTQWLEQCQLQLQQAELAVTICKANREGHQAFLETEKTLQALEQQRQIQQTLFEQQQRYRDQLGDRQTKMATLTHELDRLRAAELEIERLHPFVQTQSELEQQQQALNQQLHACQNQQHLLQRDQQRIEQLQKRYVQVVLEVEALGRLEAVIQTIPQLEAQQQRYQEQLSRIAAATQFEADLQQLVEQTQTQSETYSAQLATATQILLEWRQSMPLWAEPIETILKTLQCGADGKVELLPRLQAILNDLRQQTSPETLQGQLYSVQTQLKTALKQQAQFQTLAEKLTEQVALQTEIAEVDVTLAESNASVRVIPDLQQQLTQVLAQQTQLDNPRNQQRLLEKQLQTKPQIEANLLQLQTAMAEENAMIASLNTQLADFATLSEQLLAQQQQRELYRTSYQLYLQHRELANRFAEQDVQLKTAQAQLQDYSQQFQQATEQRDRLAATYDLQQFQTLQATYQEIHTQSVALKARLPEMQKRLADLNHQIAGMQAIQAKRNQAQIDLKQREQSKRFIAFARKAYKEAGPRITERYVYSISREADKLFRELLNRPSVSLEWTRDYEILIREGAHTRRFINLSGGEQMCAALAVRLALLRVLADIDIAFFDEPTTNMDRMRRDQLAEAIANIRSFRQLFVISHDDTFEKVTENIILVERETT
jgi:exonuclease SbcC